MASGLRPFFAGHWSAKQRPKTCAKSARSRLTKTPLLTSPATGDGPNSHEFGYGYGPKSYDFGYFLEALDLRTLIPANGREPYQPRPMARAAGRRAGIRVTELL